MNADEKYALLMEGCEVVTSISERIVAMSKATATFRRGGEAEERALNTALDVIAPYCMMLVDSDDGLEVPDAHRDANVAARMHSWFTMRSAPTAPESPLIA